MKSFKIAIAFLNLFIGSIGIWASYQSWTTDPYRFLSWDWILLVTMGTISAASMIATSLLIAYENKIFRIWRLTSVALYMLLYLYSFMPFFTDANRSDILIGELALGGFLIALLLLNIKLGRIENKKGVI